MQNANHQAPHSGAECFIDGSFYKTSKGKAWRWSAIERDWVLSNKSQREIMLATRPEKSLDMHAKADRYASKDVAARIARAHQAKAATEKRLRYAY